MRRVPDLIREHGRRGLGKPETFNFLGFTHIRGRSRAGRFLLRRRGRRGRMRSKPHEIGDAPWRHRHAPLDEQGSWLGQVVRGDFAYHAVPANSTAPSEFRGVVPWHWPRALRRRGQRDKSNWTSIDPGSSPGPGGALDSKTAHPSSMAEPTLRRQTPKAGAVCLNWARTVLCGGRVAIRVPTAIPNASIRRSIRGDEWP